MTVHLLDDDEPLILNQDLTALCGETVKLARAVCFWDESVSPDYLDMIYSIKGICRKCLGCALERHYVYAITDGRGLKEEAEDITA